MIIDEYGLLIYNPFEFEEEYEYEKGKNTLLYQLSAEIARCPKDHEYIVESLLILPAEYADRALCYAEMIDPNIQGDIKAIDDMLCARYTRDFIKVIAGDKLKQLTSFSKKDKAKYENYSKRIFDFTERIMIVQHLGYDVLEVAGRYSGEDKTKKALSDILASCDKRYYDRRMLLGRLLDPMLEKVLSDLQTTKQV